MNQERSLLFFFVVLVHRLLWLKAWIYPRGVDLHTHQGI